MKLRDNAVVIPISKLRARSEPTSPSSIDPSSSISMRRSQAVRLNPGFS
jgi:hypothetical protein